VVLGFSGVISERLSQRSATGMLCDTEIKMNHDVPNQSSQHHRYHYPI
jgi:hypothetical protein